MTTLNENSALNAVLIFRLIGALIVFAVAVTGLYLTWIGVQGESTITATLAEQSLEMNTAYPGVGVAVIATLVIGGLLRPQITAHKQADGSSGFEIRGEA